MSDRGNLIEEIEDNILATPAWTRFSRIVLKIALGLFALVLLSLVGLMGLDSRTGHEWLAGRVERLEPESGLRIGIGRIEGSLFGELVIYNLTLNDPAGRFLEAKRIDLDWRPQTFVRGRLHINALRAPEVRLLKLPKLNPSKEEKPILPDFDIYVGRLELGRVILEPPVSGKRNLLQVAGSADIDDGRLVTALRASSPTGGDALVARIDARPDDNRFDVEARLNAPPKGILAGMLKFDQPLLATISGNGSWKQWSGTVQGSLGDAELADLKLTARDGKFTAKGTASPGLAIGGLVRKLGSPSITVDLAARIAERRIDTNFTILSPSIDLDAIGVIDLANGRFEDFRTDARLLDPKALIKSLTARNMRVALTLDGALATPEVDYRLTADWLALGTTRLDQLVATGKGSKPEGRLEFPIDAKVKRVTGVGEFVEALATNVRLVGSLRLEEADLLGKRVAIKSDRVAALADIKVDTRSGAYDVKAQGTLPKYVVPGVGVADIAADLKFVPDSRDPGKLRLLGKVSAEVTRLDNSFLNWLFAGRPTLKANIDRTPNGTIAITNADLRSPDMNVVGKGQYALGEQIDFAGSAESKRFGPLRVVLDGLISRPEASVQLDSYFAGIMLSDVRAHFQPGPLAYTFSMTADSMAGVVASRGRILTEVAPTIYEVEALQIAGINATGQLRAVDDTVALAGVLDVTGQGISGTVRLSPQGMLQRYDANLAARSARLTVPAMTAIRRGTLVGSLVTAPEGADITGRFDLEGVTQGDIYLKSAEGTLEMRDGAGSAIVIAAGERGVPFTLDLATSFEPGSIVVASKGSISRQPFSLAKPLRLTAVEGGWSLAPVVLNLPSGSAKISGQFTNTITLATELNGAGLELFDLALPGIGLTGTASGRVDMTFPRGALPRGTAKLRVIDFTRVTESLAHPLDLAIVARLEANKAVVRAAFQDDGRTYGALQAQLTAIPGSIDDPWIGRLAKAPLNAELRWLGPSEMLWPLTGVDAISMRGPVGVAVRIGGLLGEPQITGRVRSTAVNLESSLSGTAVNNIDLDGRFTGSRLVLSSFRGIAGKGTISGSGHIDLSLERGFPLDLSLDMQSAEILNRDDLRATATGPLRIRNGPDGSIISGDLNIDRARFRIGRTSASEAEPLQVVERNRELVRVQQKVTVPTNWKLDVKARSKRQIEVRGMGLDSEWSADLEMKGPANRPELRGNATLIRGEYEFAGRRFKLSRGEISFTGGYPPDPIIDIAAETRVEGLVATIAIRGTGQRPEITFSSIPALPQDEVLSRVLFGTSITNLSAPEALQLAGAVASLRGGGSGLNPINSIRRAVGLDRLRVINANSSTGQKTSLAAGKYLSNRVYVEVISDTQNYSATQLEVELTRALSLLSQISTLGGTSVNLRWSKDY